MMRLCRACLEQKPENDFYQRSDVKSRRNKCKKCEKEKRKSSPIFRPGLMYKIHQMEIENKRFFICNIKFCTVHKIYHPLSFFEKRYDRENSYRSYCREIRKERKKAKRQKNRQVYTTIQEVICAVW